MAQLPSRSVTWVTLSWIHSSLYPRTFSFSTSGATPSHSKIRPGSLWITWIFCGVLLGAESRGQNTITLCRKISHYPHWKWLKRQFHPLCEISQKREHEGREQLLHATSTMFASSGEDEVGEHLSFLSETPRISQSKWGICSACRSLVAGSTCVSHIIAVNHIWLHIIILC